MFDLMIHILEIVLGFLAFFSELNLLRKLQRRMHLTDTQTAQHALWPSTFFVAVLLLALLYPSPTNWISWVPASIIFISAVGLFIFIRTHIVKKPKDEEIRLIAYYIWEDEGKISGHEDEYYLRAEVIWKQNSRKRD